MPAGAKLIGLATSLGIASCLVLLLLTACDPTTTVTFVNETENEVTIWHEKSEVTRLAPGEKKTYVFGKYSGAHTLRAIDSEDRVLFEQSLTWDQFEDLGRVVLGEDGP